MPNKVATISDELGFDAYSEGYIKFGPIRGHSPESVQRKMNIYGVFAHRDECEVYSDDLGTKGVSIVAFSEEVRGYFMDEDGHEVNSDDLDAFMGDILQEGAVLEVEGSYPTGMGGIIINRMRFMRKGDAVLRDIERAVYQKCGTRKEIRGDFELSLYEEQMRQNLASSNVVSIKAFKAARRM